MSDNTNLSLKWLTDINAIDPDSVTEIFPRVGDNEDVQVLQCQKSKTIFLSRTDHMSISHYEEIDNFEYWKSSNRKSSINFVKEDTDRSKDLDHSYEFMLQKLDKTDTLIVYAEK